MKATPKKIPQRAELLSLLFAVGLVLLNAYLAYTAWTAYGRDRDQLEVTQQVAGGANALLSSLKDAETGQRGFF